MATETENMKHRIRAAVIILEGDSVLLVRERDASDEDDIWIPPGGGVEGAESLEECVKRETLEETGLSVELGDIAYVRDFLGVGYHHCEIFFLATSYSGDIVIGENPELGILDFANEILDVRFVHRDEMRQMAISPDVLKTTFWDDLAEGFPRTRYLGVRKSRDLQRLEGRAET